MKKNQERRLHRKNAKIAKEGGTPLTLNRSAKPDTTVSIHPLLSQEYIEKATLYRICLMNAICGPSDRDAVEIVDNWAT